MISKLELKEDTTCLVCKLQTKISKISILEMQFLGNLTSQNLAASSVLTSQIDPKKFSRYLGHLLFHIAMCEMPKKLVFKIQNGL